MSWKRRRRRLISHSLSPAWTQNAVARACFTRRGTEAATAIFMCVFILFPRSASNTVVSRSRIEKVFHPFSIFPLTRMNVYHSIAQAPYLNSLMATRAHNALCIRLNQFSTATCIVYFINSFMHFSLAHLSADDVTRDVWIGRQIERSFHQLLAKIITEQKALLKSNLLWL